MLKITLHLNMCKSPTFYELHITSTLKNISYLDCWKLGSLVRIVAFSSLLIYVNWRSTILRNPYLLWCLKRRFFRLNLVLRFRLCLNFLFFNGHLILFVVLFLYSVVLGVSFEVSRFIEFVYLTLHTTN